MSDPLISRRLVIVNGAVPAAILAWDAWSGGLGSNAVNQALHVTGVLSLVFLALTLSVTPLKGLTGWGGLVAYRRALGLYGFWYAVAHLVIYVAYDRAGDWRSTLEEVGTRVYLQVGLAALVLMTPLAVTSTDGMISRLTPKRWKLLHRLTYVVVALGTLHFYLLVKSDVRLPLAFAAVFGGLLGYRLLKALGSRKKVRPIAATAPLAAKPTTYRGPLRVAAVFQETPTVKTFRFVPVNGGDRPFAFHAGQFLTVALEVDGKTHRRCYTIASSPTRVGAVEITVRRDPNGVVSRRLHDTVRVGDVVNVVAPGGRFHLDTPSTDAVVLIGGGVGITPVMAMLRRLTDISWEGAIHFLQVARTAEDLIYDDELTLLSRRHANLRRVIILSDDPGSPVTDFHGRLSVDILRTVPAIQTLPVYLCGPEGMMQAVGELLREVGAPAENLYTEAFGGAKPAAAASELETIASDTQTVPLRTISFTRSGVTVEVERGVTLLEAAEQADVPVTWECRAGVCGQCKVRCSEGEVDYGAAQALTTKDRAMGYVLSCQATALSDLVAVEA